MSIVRDLIAEYESCCREVEELRCRIKEIIKANADPESSRSCLTPLRASKGMRAGLRDGFEAFRHASPEFTISQGVWVSSPVDDETRGIVRLEEERMQNTRERMDLVLSKIVDALPQSAAQASDKLLFLLNYTLLNEGVEMDYFIFSVIEAALIIKEEVVD
jgi:hypothetical protein